MVNLLLSARVHFQAINGTAYLGHLLVLSHHLDSDNERKHMLAFRYLSLVQMFKGVLGDEINSCLSYLTIINIQILQGRYWPWSFITADLTLPVAASPSVTPVQLWWMGAFLKGSLQKEHQLCQASALISESTRTRRNTTLHVSPQYSPASLSSCV